MPIIPVLVQELRVSKFHVLRMPMLDTIDTFTIFMASYINEHRLVNQMKRKVKAK